MVAAPEAFDHRCPLRYHEYLRDGEIDAKHTALPNPSRSANNFTFIIPVVDDRA